MEGVKLCNTKSRVTFSQMSRVSFGELRDDVMRIVELRNCLRNRTNVYLLNYLEELAFY